MVARSRGVKFETTGEESVLAPTAETEDEAYQILEEVAVWLGYEKPTDYNDACSHDGRYQARARLEKAKV